MANDDLILNVAEDEAVYEDTASHRDLLTIQQVVESGDVEIPNDRVERLARMGLLRSGELIANGWALYENIQQQRNGILERLSQGRDLNAADLRGSVPGDVPLVQFENAQAVDEDVFMRAVVNWMRLLGELRYEHEENRFVLAGEP